MSVSRDLAALPRLIVANDPDSTSTALAWAVRREDGAYVFAGCEGGGSRAVTWQTITGARAQLTALRNRSVLPVSPREVDVVIEAQAPAGPQSADCEELRRVRYHWQAACEVDRYDCYFVEAHTWQPAFTRGEPKERGAGAMKRMYQRKAKGLTSLAVNEDRCAAIGMLWWYVHDVIGSQLIFDRG